jgi:glyoxylase-like metal-dependent hydrolase (beta-lactamase superfamily II)
MPVNAFVAISDAGLWLVDGGLDTAQCQAALADGVAALGYSARDNRGLLITHFHADHVGVAQAVADTAARSSPTACPPDLDRQPSMAYRAHIRWLTN